MNYPEKLYYTIGEVCKLTDTKAHILRYWESQFRLLRPARRYSGHRKYTSQDIDLIHRIRHLIIERKFTLSGAKKEIQRHMTNKAMNPASSSIENTHTVLRELKKEVDECLTLLSVESKPRQQELLNI